MGELGWGVKGFCSCEDQLIKGNGWTGGWMAIVCLEFGVVGTVGRRSVFGLRKGYEV